MHQQATGPLCAGQATRAREGVDYTDYGRLVPSLTMDRWTGEKTLNEGLLAHTVCLGLCIHALRGTSCDLL